MKKVFQTDWLGTRPVFYHEQTGAVSHSVADVFDCTEFEIDAAGLRDYLDFGYAVFGQTPIRHVKFLPSCSRLVSEDGRLDIKALPDPVDEWLGRTSIEEDVLERMVDRVGVWERSVAGEIVIPTSGGYDSRLLNWLVGDKARIRSFTYGLSEPQAASTEVVRAKHLADILGTRWQFIPLGDFHLYFDLWDALYGPATHAHGMYHIEFFAKMMPLVSKGSPFLTGIAGDAWAGSIPAIGLDSARDLTRLGYSHGVHADPSRLVLRARGSARDEYWREHKDRLADPRYQVVALIRLKMILLSYLIRIPEYFGFKVWSPFLDPDVCLSMLTLRSARRRDRVWQADLFRRVGLDLEAQCSGGSTQNNLDGQAIERLPPTPLDVDVLSEVVTRRYVEWINRSVRRSGLTDRLLWRLHKQHLLGRCLRRAGVRHRGMDAYFAYVTLRPVERLLKRRNAGHA